LVAAGTFSEWDFDDADGFPSLKGLMYACDARRQATYDMAEVVFSSFRHVEKETAETPFDYGTVVLFERLRIESASPHESDTVWALIGEIARRFRRRRPRPAFIILRAFPLEYQGNVTKANEAAFTRRQRALMRLYVHRLGLETLPGQPGKDGWQWLRINCPLRPKPSRRDR
jgi:hypothetical protein